MIFAGLGFAGAPLTAIPAAHSIPEMMSESSPPHLPTARTGSSRAFQATPAIPRLLLVAAARMPATRVPCQLLGSGAPCTLLHTPPGELLTSCVVTQSPVSVAPGP